MSYSAHTVKWSRHAAVLEWCALFLENALVYSGFIVAQMFNLYFVMIKSRLLFHTAAW